MQDALDLITRNCFRSFRVLPDAEIVDDGGVFGVATRVPLTFFNGVVAAPAESIPAVVDFFRQRRCPFRWWVRDGIGSQLLANGMRYVWDSAGMIADLRQLPAYRPPRDLKIERVCNDALMGEWARLLMTVFERPASDIPIWREAYGALGYDSEWAHFVGSADGEMVATTSVLLGGEVAGIYHVATLSSARGRGFGSALTHAALLHAVERGAREAALQSSELGLSVYRSLGFREHCALSMYDWRPELSPES